ncbi:helix-turn-helix domain-containing protein [Xenorhabdus sp. XENO-1]|uniref:helix-turn-helix domain-containing protein n=1 Tax=Xenorhabdus bovienii TaxID=40576 RepID=UPI0020CA27B0|nr:helix-turn-helix domain-containing protein [Xenorhabdus bovienii]MCP9269697.1 helix-turn-helix domain-containing protein [Xenorhabdus bovienii subsp. africana]
MSMILMAKSMQIKVGSTARKMVLLKLADNANDKGECFPSYQHIADQCEMSRRSVINHIDVLCEQGLVRKVYRKSEKGNSSNIYILNLDGARNSPPSENSAPCGEPVAPPSENIAPTPSENSAPRISHSFEPVNEPINDPIAKVANAPCVENKYAFKGTVIKLNQKSYDNWKKIFPHIDLDTQLRRLDIEFQAEKPKNWFVTTSQKLNYQNLQAGNKIKPAKRITGKFSDRNYGQTDIPNWAEV